ncbi:MAG: hypothetical protein QOD96_7642 [Pseudonocardiales bacterium]|nr:hypothetical protein [Pseudonocardiales bacterium]
MKKHIGKQMQSVKVAEGLCMSKPTFQQQIDQEGSANREQLQKLTAIIRGKYARKQ